MGCVPISAISAPFPPKWLSFLPPAMRITSPAKQLWIQEVWIREGEGRFFSHLYAGKV